MWRELYVRFRKEKEKEKEKEEKKEEIFVALRASESTYHATTYIHASITHFYEYESVLPRRSQKDKKKKKKHTKRKTNRWTREKAPTSNVSMEFKLSHLRKHKE